MTSNYPENFSILREVSRPMSRPEMHILPRNTPDFIRVPVEGRLSALTAFSPGDIAPPRCSSGLRPPRVGGFFRAPPCPRRKIHVQYPQAIPRSAKQARGASPA